MKVTTFFNLYVRPGHRKVTENFWGFCKMNFGLFGLWLGAHLLLQTIDQVSALQISQEPNIPLLLATVFCELTLSFLIYLLVPPRFQQFLSRQSRASSPQLFSSYAKDLISEILRIASGVIVGLVMGIVPGLLRMVRWAFVPYIVTTNPAYAKGQIDALKYSEKLSKGHILSISIFWIFLTLCDLVLFFMQKLNVAGTTDFAVWTWQVVPSLISFLIRLYAVLLTYVVYESLRSNEGKDELNI